MGSMYKPSSDHRKNKTPLTIIYNFRLRNFLHRISNNTHTKKLKALYFDEVENFPLGNTVFGDVHKSWNEIHHINRVIEKATRSSKERYKIILFIFHIFSK